MNTGKLKSSALPIIIILGSVLFGVLLVYFLKIQEPHHEPKESDEIKTDKELCLEENKAVDWVKQHSGTYRERSDRGEIRIIDCGVGGIRDEVRVVTLEFETVYEGYGKINPGESPERVNETREMVLYLLETEPGRIAGPLVAIVDDTYDDTALTYDIDSTNYRSIKSVYEGLRGGACPI